MEPNLETPNVAPAPAVDPGIVPASPAASPVVDPSVSLNPQLQALLDENRNLKSGMNEAQRKAAEAQKRLREVEPILDYSEKDPNFMPYIYEKARGYGSNEGESSSMDPAVLRALDPVFRDNKATREKVESWEYHQQMDKLAHDFPDVMTTDAKASLSADAYGTGVYDLEYHFYKRFGKDLITKAMAQGTQAAVKTIQDNNKLYVTGTTTTAIAPPTDYSQLSAEDKQKATNEEIDKILSDPDYAAKVARQVG